MEGTTIGRNAQKVGLLNIISTDIMNKLALSNSLKETTALRNLQQRADVVTFDLARDASLTLNERRLYTPFAKGEPISNIISGLTLTSPQKQLKSDVESALSKKYTDDEINNAPRQTPNRKSPKSRKSKVASKQKLSVSDKNSIILKGDNLSQSLDENGNKVTMSFKDYINKAQNAINNFKC